MAGVPFILWGIYQEVNQCCRCYITSGCTVGWATATLLGPGKVIVVDGCADCASNMNTLKLLTAYTVSLSPALPQLGWECFFDEPVMLLGFILLGRMLEQQAEVVQQQL